MPHSSGGGSGGSGGSGSRRFGSDYYRGSHRYVYYNNLKNIPEDDPRYQSYLCETDKEKPLEAQCAHCGGMYVQGLHDRCPYCGEPVESG